MSYMYGKLNESIAPVEYTGLDSTTASTKVDNVSKTIQVDVPRLQAAENNINMLFTSQANANNRLTELEKNSNTTSEYIESNIVRLDTKDADLEAEINGIKSDILNFKSVFSTNKTETYDAINRVDDRVSQHEEYTQSCINSLSDRIESNLQLINSEIGERQKLSEYLDATKASLQEDISNEGELRDSEDKRLAQLLANESSQRALADQAIRELISSLSYDINSKYIGKLTVEMDDGTLLGKFEPEEDCNIVIPSVSGPRGTCIRNSGDWIANKQYFGTPGDEWLDLVIFEEHLYICNTTHTSSDEVNPANSEVWNLII